MVEKVYEFQPGDLVTALFYDRRKNELKWQLGLALKLEKARRRDRVAQKRWKIYWGKDKTYSIVDFRILSEWLSLATTNNLEEITAYHDVHQGLIKSTVAVTAGACGQISNPIRDDMLTDEIRDRIIDAVSVWREPVERAQLEIDKILNEISSKKGGSTR